MSRVYGYVRKGYPMNLTEQLESIYKYNCDEIIVEAESLNDHSELNNVLANIKKGDSLVIPSLKVIGKTLPDLMKMLQFFYHSSIHIICLEGSLDTKYPISFFKATELLVEAEVARKDYCFQNRMDKSNPDNIIGRPSLSDEKIKQIQMYYRDHQMTLRAIADECNVSLGAVHKYAKQVIKTREVNTLEVSLGRL